MSTLKPSVRSGTSTTPPPSPVSEPSSPGASAEMATRTVNCRTVSPVIPRGWQTGTYPPSPPRVHRRRAVVLEEHHLVRVLPASHLHPRRPGGHPRYGDTRR